MVPSIRRKTKQKRARIQQSSHLYRQQECPLCHRSFLTYRGGFTRHHRACQDLHTRLEGKTIQIYHRSKLNLASPSGRSSPTTGSGSKTTSACPQQSLPTSRIGAQRERWCVIETLKSPRPPINGPLAQLSSSEGRGNQRIGPESEGS